MDTTDNVWMEIFKQSIFNNHPAERLSKITSWMNNSRDAGAIATRHLEDALRLVRQSAPTAEWLGQMIDAKNSNIFIYVVPLTAYVRTPDDFPIVSSAIDAGLYIRELYVSADIDSTIYTELQRKWMESKECIDRLVVDDFDLDPNLSVLH